MFFLIFNIYPVITYSQFIGYWYSSDVEVFNGSVRNTPSSFREIDMKQGEDGWLYLAINKATSAGPRGRITIYSSFDGGASWQVVSEMTNPTGYFLGVTMLVESRNNSVGDSTRIIIYTCSAFVADSTSGNNSRLLSYSVKRNSTGSYQGIPLSPVSGNRFINPTSCSNGVYESSNTVLHVIVREEKNDSAVFVKFHHLRSTDFGATFIDSAFYSEGMISIPLQLFSLQKVVILSS